MKMNPVVTSYRHFNALLLGIALLLLLLAVRKLSIQPSVPAIAIAVVALVGAIVTFYQLRIRRGVVLIGCTRRSFDRVREQLLKDKPLGTTYRPGRGIGLVRELFAHHRDQAADDKALAQALNEYFTAYPQQLTPRDCVLLAAWGIGLFIAALFVARLLLA